MADEEIKEKINNLTNSDIIQNDRLDDCEEELEKVHEILDGDPKDRADNGLKGDVHELTRRLNKLEAMMAPDSLGQGGIITRLKTLESGERTHESRWKFKTAVVVAFIGTLTALVTNLDRIEKFFEPRSSIQPAPKKRRVVKRVIRQTPPVDLPPERLGP